MVPQEEVDKAKEYARNRVKKKKLPAEMEADREQFLIEVELAVDEAKLSYNPALAGFQTYAYGRVTNTIKQTMRDLHHLPRSLQETCCICEEARKKYSPLSLDTHIANSNTTFLETLVDEGPDTQELALGSLHREHLLGRLGDAIKTLSEKEKAVIVGHFLQEKELKTIATELGYKEASYMTQIKTRAIQKLRNYFQSETLEV